MNRLAHTVGIIEVNALDEKNVGSPDEGCDCRWFWEF